MAMTRQEMFDRAVRGLHGQGYRRSETANKQCLYRGPAGRKCAIGHLIPGDVSFKDNGIPIWHAPHLLADVCQSTKEMLDWLGELQLVHDANLTPDSMRAAAIEFASRHGLTFPEGC